MGKNLNITEVIEKELGVATKDTPFSILCPFHNDTDPSMRVYPDSDEGQGSCFCWGACNTSWTPVTFIKKYKGFSWSETFEYIFKTYGVEFKRHKKCERDSNIMDSIHILSSSNFFKTDKRIKAFEIAVIRYLKGDKEIMNKCIEKSIND